MNYQELKNAIIEVIRTNGNEEITGEVLQFVLLEMVSSLGKDFQFAGVATPQTEIIERDDKVAWVLGAGTYENFGIPFTVAVDEIAFVLYNGTYRVQKVKTGVIVDDTLTREGQNPVKGGAIYAEFDKLRAAGYLFAGVATPSLLPPASLTEKIFYLATQGGEYPNLDNITLQKGINIIRFDGTSWICESLIAITDEVIDSNVSLITAAGVYRGLSGKVDKAEGMGLSQNSYSNTEKSKLGALPTAQELVQMLGGKQDVLTFDTTPTLNSHNPVTSDGIQRAIEAILVLIPSAASALNQLADKSFVNSTVATASATFRGTYNLVSDLSLAVTATHVQIASALAGAVSGADNNDYCFVQIPTSADTPTEIRVTERYKFNGTTWAYEYDLNNSGFTAAQWEAINSAITSALVTKLSNLPDATQLANLFAGKQNTLTFDDAPVSGSSNPVKSGGIYDAIAAITAVIPSAATSSNKLVDLNALTTYVTGIIGALDASFDLTSADGHVTLKMTQVDGVITTLQILTSDIASAQALATLGGQVSTNADDIAALQQLYNNLQQSDPIVIEPTDTWPVANPSTHDIYRVIDRVNTPPQYYSDYMFKADDLTTPVLMATYNNAIDAVPTAGSHNLVESGGVQNELALGAVYDVSAKNPTAGPNYDGKFESLAALLSDDNLNTLIPDAYRKGGMSIKFVQSSDNKYVQYRLMASSFSINVFDWQKVGDEELTEKMEIVTETTIYKGRYFAASGNNVIEQADATRCLTDFIPVSGLSAIYVHHMMNITSSPFPQLAVYDANKQYLDRYGLNSNDTVINLSEVPGTSFVRASMSLTNIGDTFISANNQSGENIFDGSFFAKTMMTHIVDLEENIDEVEADVDVLQLYSNKYGKKATFFLNNENKVAEAKIGNNIDKIRLNWTGSNFAYYLISYTDADYSEGRQNTEWKYYPGIEDIADKTLYYVVHFEKRDSTAFTQVELESIDVDVVIAAADYTVKPDGIYVEKAALTFGNSKYPSSNVVFGYDLYNTCKSIKIVGDTSSYSYYIEGYNDAVMRDNTHKVYETGWQYYPKEFVFDNTSLYYVLTIQKRNGTDIEESDLSALSVFVTRNIDDVFAEKKQGNIYENDIDAIPSYYFEGFYLPNKVATINNLLYGCAAKGDAFIFITDQHWYDGARKSWNARMSPNLMKYIIDNTSIDKIFDGGDREDGPSNAFTEKCFEALQDKNYFPVLGNHEIITAGSTIDAAYASSFQHLSNNALVVWGADGELNYYVDNNVQKIRYVFLQSMVQDAEGTQQTGYVKLGYPNDTVSWLQNTALNVAQGWTIIVVTHYLAQCDDTNKTIKEPENSTFWNENNYHQVMEALKNYNGNGTIACVLHGHTHWDASLVVQGVKNNFPIIVTTSDRLNMAGVGEDHQEDRVAGTITENAFDVVVLDKTQRKITCVRVGAPAWTDYSQPDWGKEEIREFTY